MPSDAVLRGLFSRTQQYAVPLHSCRAVAHAVLQSLRCVRWSCVCHCDRK